MASLEIGVIHAYAVGKAVKNTNNEVPSSQQWEPSKSLFAALKGTLVWGVNFFSKKG